MAQLLTTVGTIRQGQAAQTAANFEAAQLDRQAKTAEAESQRKAQETRRQTDLLQSKARAAAAAGGGTSTDVGVTNILQDITAEGELGALSNLFEGRSEASKLRLGATSRRFEGKQARQAATVTAISGLIDSASKAATGGVG